MMYNNRLDTYLMPISFVKQFAEFNRCGEDNIKGNKYIEELTQDIKLNGIQTPLILGIDGGKALLVEGNHRLCIAERLDIKMVPVRISYQNFGSINVHKAKPIYYRPERWKHGLFNECLTIKAILKEELEKIAGFNRNQIFYHGTRTQFDNFDSNKIGSSTDSGWWGKGFYFHSSGDSDAYGKFIIGAKLDLKNPLILPVDLYGLLSTHIHLNPELKNKSDMALIKSIGAQEFTNLLLKLGYDGVVINYEQGTTEVVVFKARDIHIVERKQLYEFLSPSISSYKVQMVTIESLEYAIGEDRNKKPIMMNGQNYSEANINKLMNDIQLNGFKEACILAFDPNKKEAAIIEGNHRIEAAIRLGLKEVPVRLEVMRIRDDHERKKDGMYPLMTDIVMPLKRDMKPEVPSDLGYHGRPITPNDYLPKS